MHVDLTTACGAAVDPYVATARRLGGSEFLLNIVHIPQSLLSPKSMIQTHSIAPGPASRVIGERS
jgi:hypothetical protein